MSFRNLIPLNLRDRAFHCRSSLQNSKLGLNAEYAKSVRFVHQRPHFTRLSNKLSTAASTATPIQSITNNNSSYFRWIIGVAKGACLFILFSEYIGQVSFTIGPSMLPTFNMIGDWLVIEKLSMKLWSNGSKLRRGDVIVAISPVKPTSIITKRIIGLPGDEILIDPTRSLTETIVVPEGKVWLQGDNYNYSKDSRTYGPVPIGLIKGKVVARIFPDPCWVGNNIHYDTSAS